MLELTARKATRNRLRHLPTLSLLIITSCGLAMDSEDLLNRATDAMAEGDYRAAAIDARNVLQKEPDDIAARIMLGRAALAMNDGKSAEKELRRALSLGAEPAQVMTGLAGALLLQQKFDVVIAEISVESATTEADRVALTRSRAKAYIGMNQPVTARDLYMDILASDSEDIDALLGVVETYIAAKNFSQARETLNQILSRHDESTAARITSGSLYYRTRRFEPAERDYRTALELAVQDSERQNEILAWTGLAEVRLAEDKLVEAKVAVDRLLVLAPDAIATIYFDARVAYLGKDLSRAQQRLQQVLNVAPKYRPAQMLLGAVHLHTGNLAQAEMYLSAVVAAVPSHTAARRLLAETRLQLNRVDDAKAVLRPVLEGLDADASTYGIAARASMKSGDIDEAIDYLQRAIRMSPGDSDLMLDLAGVLIAEGRVDDARALLEDMPDTAGRGKHRRELLEILVDIRDGETASALGAAEDLLSRNPDDAQLLNFTGHINFSTGNFDTARKLFARAQSLNPDDISLYLSLARIDIAEEDLIAARAHYESAVEISPEDARPLVALARLSALEGQREESEEWLDRARKADANAIAPRIILGRLYLARRDFRSAEKVVREALQTKDSIAELQNLLGLAQRGQGNHANSLRSFKKTTELERDNPDYRLNLAKAQISMANQGLARDLLEKSYEKYQTHIPTGVLLSALTARMGNIDQAMAIAKELQKRNPDSGIPNVLEGELLAGRKLYQQAADAYDAALDRNNDRDTAVRAFRLRVLADTNDPYTPLLNYLAIRPANNEVRLILAQGYEVGGSADKAIAEYEIVVQSSPDNLVALNNLAWVYMIKGDSRAEDTAQRAYDLAPDNGTVVDTLGWIILRSGSVEDGVDLLRKAVELANGRPEVRYHLAAGLLKMGQVDEARGMLEEILATDEVFASREDAEELLHRL